jgi:dihydroorotate dehydrogenase (NAD+) catalytic subunit
MTDLSTEIAGLSLRNPVLLASGCAGYGAELDGLLDWGGLGGLVTKGVSLDPWEGNPPPRVAETASGMLNAIGLQNVGLARFCAEKADYLAAIDCPVIVNVIGRSREEYVAVTEGLRGRAYIDALELNISCPNIKAGGIQFGTQPAAAARITRAVVDAADRPVWVKLAPTVADIGEMARAVADAGAAALSVTNTIPGMAIDLERRRAVLGNGVGGLSGPAIKPVALRLVHACASAVQLPIVGIGGIASGRDALEFLLAGASAVQIGTASLVEPGAGTRIAGEMCGWMESNGVRTVRELIGTLGGEPARSCT